MKELRRICFRERLVPATLEDDLPPGTRERYTIAYWLEFADGCLYISGQDMKLYRCRRVPEDAKPIPVVDDELATGSMPRSFVGASLVSIAHDEPYLLRFDNGGVINFAFDYYLFTDGPQNSYLSPDFFSPAWFAAPENAERKDDFAAGGGGEGLIDLAGIPAEPKEGAIDPAGLPAAQELAADMPFPASGIGSVPLGRKWSVLRLYGLLAWCALILFPLIAGLGAWQPAAVLLFWLAALLLRRVCAECRLGWLLAMVGGIGAVIFAGYGWWCARIGSPTPFAEGWYWPCGLDFPAPTQMQLLGMAAFCLVVTLLLPHPRWHWWRGWKDEIPLLPWLALGVPLAWAINEALLRLYLNGLLPLLMPVGGH